MNYYLQKQIEKKSCIISIHKVEYLSIWLTDLDIRAPFQFKIFKVGLGTKAANTALLIYCRRSCIKQRFATFILYSSSSAQISKSHARCVIIQVVVGAKGQFWKRLGIFCSTSPRKKTNNFGRDH